MDGQKDRGDQKVASRREWVVILEDSGATILPDVTDPLTFMRFPSPPKDTPSAPRASVQSVGAFSDVFRFIHEKLMQHEVNGIILITAPGMVARTLRSMPEMMRARVLRHVAKDLGGIEPSQLAARVRALCRI